MTERKNGRPAYAIPRELWQDLIVEDAKDMTLRDYFAAKVLVTACEDHGPMEAAEMAYRYADAMLEARK